MKKIIPFILLFGFFSCVLSAQPVKMKNDPVGKWSFNAPYAPYGYSTGTVDIGYEEKAYTIKMSFTEMGYSYTGENVKVRNDSLFFELSIEGTPISNSLTMKDDTTMEGAAVYFEGTVPYTMKKEINKEE